MTLKQCIETVVFPSEWKKGNIVPIHKVKKKTPKNYDLVSLLIICGEILKDSCLTKCSKFY